jgi:hypothetical protein
MRDMYDGFYPLIWIIITEGGRTWVWATMLLSRVRWNRRSVAASLPSRWLVACTTVTVAARRRRESLPFSLFWRSAQRPECGDEHSLASGFRSLPIARKPSLRRLLPLVHGSLYRSAGVETLLERVRMLFLGGT